MKQMSWGVGMLERWGRSGRETVIKSCMRSDCCDYVLLVALVGSGTTGASHP